jgi:hypothetical protein
MTRFVGKREMISRNAMALVLLFAYLIVNLGCPISSQAPGKAAKRTHLAQKAIEPSAFKGCQPDRGQTQIRSPGAPRSESPITGFLISDQPRMRTAVAQIPQLVESFAFIPMTAYRLPEIHRAPDTPPPRLSIS